MDSVYENTHRFNYNRCGLLNFPGIQQSFSLCLTRENLSANSFSELSLPIYSKNTAFPNPKSISTGHLGFNSLTSRPECTPESRYTGVGVLFFVI